MALDPKAMVQAGLDPDEILPTNVTPPAADAAALSEDEQDARVRWPEPDPEAPFPVTLPEPFATWLRDRAAAHGTRPEAHAADLLRLAWQTDTWRLAQTGPTVLA